MFSFCIIIIRCHLEEHKQIFNSPVNLTNHAKPFDFVYHKLTIKFSFREREKISQREDLWQQVEEKARLHPEWNKIGGGEFKENSYSEVENNADGTDSANDIENDNLTYDKLEQESRDVS